VELRSVERIWSKGSHNAFTDLLAVDGRLFCAFREGDSHVGGSNGRIRVITLEPGDSPAWRSVVLLEEPGVDLRDPKLSIAPDGRIMIGFGGSIYEGTTLRSCRSRVAFLDRRGGRSGPVREVVVDDRIRTDHDWLWRTTWHEGVGYGVVYQASPDASGIHLVSTVDGVNWDRRASLPVPGTPNEVTLRFAPDGSMRALIRREGGDGRAWFGAAEPPFDRWSFTPLPESLGGPDFIRLADDRWLVGGRRRGDDGPRTVLGIWDERADGGWTDVAVLPSGGDTSYPGFVRIDDEILVSYYSSHEGRTAIHLARLALEPASSVP
ncbi:MAG: exo-alpha-sialidase, partial [Phycisphaeraceae bacterium]|nr:exo-alpha-sialidase [Phycisphaeraceae bacterium]